MVERLTRNPRFFIVLALILALIAAGLVYLLLNNATKPVVVATGGEQPGVFTPTAVMTKEVVALANVPAYTVLNDIATVNKFFAEQDVPVGRNVPSDAFTSLQDFLNYLSTGHPGRYTSATILGSQVVRKSVLADLNGRQSFSLSLQMPQQRVAESISIPPLAASGGGVQTGDQVDVLLTLPTDTLYNYKDPKRQSGPQQTQTLLENVPVLASQPPTYTLMLTHQDAVLLKFVKDTYPNAGMELILRSWLDPNSKDFKTLPVLPEYLTTRLKSNFSTPPAPLLPSPGAVR